MPSTSPRAPQEIKEGLTRNDPNEAGAGASTQPSDQVLQIPAPREGNPRAFSSRRFRIMLLLGLMVVIPLFLSIAYLRFTPRQSPIDKGGLRPPPVTTLTPQAGSGSTELPTLFPGLAIKRREEGIAFETIDDQGPAQVLGHIVEVNIETVEDASLVQKLVNDYIDHFNEGGWKFYLAADGPTGGLYGWKSEGRYFILRYEVEPDSEKMTSAAIFYNDS